MNRILFFLPFWWDHVYSDFDPWADRWTPDKEHWRFLWELDDRVPFDGILFSRVKVEDSQTKLGEIENAGGIRNYLRIPLGCPLFGDCGAFGYIDENNPPYDPLETLDFYDKMQYDLACTVDHLIVKATEDERHHRLNITLRNAEKMMNKWSSGNYRYELIGVAQGWDPASYRRSVNQLLDMNFTHIALGGLVRSRTPTVIRVLEACSHTWQNRRINVHVFGVARRSLFPFYLRHGITSFDNAYHRKAWLSGKRNYELGEDGYTAIRIPITHRGSRERTPEEQKVFDILRQYVQSRAKPEKVVQALEAFEDSLVATGIEGVNRFERLRGLKQDYLRTLRERPWKKCSCSICGKYGVHVCVFRTNERNMRRGFHNLYQFYTSFQKWLNESEVALHVPRYLERIPFDELRHKQVLVIAACSQTKLACSPKLKAKAKEMYRGQLFMLTRKLSEQQGWDYVIMSAKYGLLFPEDQIEGYKKVLKTKKDIELIKARVVPRLREIVPNYDHILVVAGKNYREVIRELADDRFILLKSKGYGDLCAKLRAHIKSNKKIVEFT